MRAQKESRIFILCGVCENALFGNRYPSVSRCECGWWFNGGSGSPAPHRTQWTFIWLKQWKMYSNKITFKSYGMAVDCCCCYAPADGWLGDITTDEFVRKLPRHRKCKTYVLAYSLVKLLRCHTNTYITFFLSFISAVISFVFSTCTLFAVVVTVCFSHQKCCLRSFHAMLTSRIRDLLAALDEIKCKQKRILFL